MTKYLVTYDLIGTSETSANYKRLIEAIKRYPEWGKIQMSVWVVRTDWSGSQIFDDLWAFMHSKDRLFVTQIEANSKWENELTPAGWLKQFLETP